jgi:aminoglycoside 2''-phosphotransferase
MELVPYRRVIHERLPWMSIEKTIPILEGWSNFIILVNDEYIFRFPRHAQARSRAEKEILVLGELSGALDIPMPRVEQSWFPDVEGDLAFISYRKIVGDALSPELTTSRELATQLGSLLTGIHSFRVPDDLREILTHYSPPEWRQEYADFYSWAKQNVYPWVNKEARSHETALWEEYLDQPLNFCFQPVFVHRDLGAEHILCDQQHKVVTGIIDWEDAAIGDPAIDFVGLNMVGGRDFIERVLGSYRGTAGENFWERLSFYQAIIPYHEYRFGLEIGDDHHIRAALEDIMCRSGMKEQQGSGVLT